MSRNDWARVSRERHCPRCDHPDWCLIARDGSACICQRVESDKRIGDAGWLHKLADPVGLPTPMWTEQPPPPPQVNFGALHEECLANLHSGDGLHLKLGLSIDSLARMGLGWHRAHGCYTFPMMDHKRRIIGLRTRFPDGRKACIVGSRTGLFIPLGLNASELWIVEGPTDCAALLGLGFNAIGRPSNTGGHDEMVSLVDEFSLNGNRIKSVVILYDRDAPKSVAERATTNGAKRLAASLVSIGRYVRMFRPPHKKDVRQWVIDGADRRTVQYVADAAAYARREG